MFLTKIKRSQFYQVVYEVDGKRNTVSPKTADLKEAQAFLNTSSPPSKEKQIQLSHAAIITLLQFKDEYLKYAKLRFSKSYVERSIEPAFKFLIDFAGDIPLKQLNLKTLDNFIINKYNSTKSGAALYYSTLKTALSKTVNWNYLSDNSIVNQILNSMKTM